MKTVIVGMGVQGNKRKKFLGKDFLYSVDKYKKAHFKTIYDVPLNEFDAALICLPDREKLKIINYCIRHKKHVLVEKPLIIKKLKVFNDLEKKAKKNKVVCYVAYNHRFEPNILKLKNLIDSQILGKIYRCRIFYGNGTSRLVKKSKWRDKDLGVLSDLGSHLLDLCLFLFGNKISKSKVIELNNFENRSPDHSIITLNINKIKIELEMTLCMWKNTFTTDIIASKGSAHLNSLCKWDKNYFIYRKRKLPSGKPKESIKKFKKGDPTWKKEYVYFKHLIKNKKKTSFRKDKTISNFLLKLN
tara:strand:+ start:3759 stop:4661 length:903 start_codon:yes stop_codon:yes gene_type:complete